MGLPKSLTNPLDNSHGKFPGKNEINNTALAKLSCFIGPKRQNTFQ